MIYLDGQKTLESDGAEQSVLGYRSAILQYETAAVYICPGPIQSGFFWVEKEPPSEY